MDSINYSAKCVGTLGEIFQGPLFTKGGVEISIISALSQNMTKATFCPGEYCNLESLGKFKVKGAISNFFEKVSNQRVQGHWSFESDMVIGAGMSSSTADIIASLRCICKALDIIPTLDNFIECLKGVERSDSVHIDVPCMYMSQQQKIVDLYKPVGRMYCVYALEKEKIDTSKTRDILTSYYNDEKENYLELLKKVRESFFDLNKSQIISCSTHSADLSQGVFPKNSYSTLRSKLRNVCADGIIVAHTGSLIGYLYASKPDYKTISIVRSVFEEQGLQANYGEIF